MPKVLTIGSLLIAIAPLMVRIVHEVAREEGPFILYSLRSDATREVFARFGFVFLDPEL